MVLRTQVEWALHCCAVLARLTPDRRLATKVLAEFHGVPKEYLSKALQALAQAGLIEGTLGVGGGYRLARPPAAISLLDIVEAVEGRKRTFECSEIRANNPCLQRAEKKFSAPCAVARFMGRADEAWRAELRRVTLAELVNVVARDVPYEIQERTAAWLAKR